MKKKKYGFTLVELLVVIAILAILATVSVIGYLSFLEKARVSNDNTLAAQFNTLIETQKVEDENIDLNDLKTVYEENFGKSFEELEPESAQYGYHFWFNTNDEKVVLAKSSDLNSSTLKNANSKSYEKGTDLREQLIDGYDYNDANIYNIALDSPSIDLSFYGFDFSSRYIDKETNEEVVGDFAYNNYLTWKVISGNATIDEYSGILSISHGGRIVVVATANGINNEVVEKNITINIGTIVSLNIEFNGQNISLLEGNKYKILYDESIENSFYYEEYIQLYYDFIKNDTTLNISCSNNDVVIDCENKKIILNSLNSFVLTFETKNGIVVEYEFEVQEVQKEFDAISCTLEHRNDFLYKIGNRNQIELDKLWMFNKEVIENNGLTINDLTITYNIIDSITNNNLDSKYFEITQDILNIHDYQGCIKVQIVSSYLDRVLNEIEVPLEVLDGYNVYDYDDLISNEYENKMVLANIELEKYVSKSFIKNATLYGNAFTLDGSKVVTNENMSWYGLLYGENCIIDNINVIGPTFPEITYHNSKYAPYTIRLDGDKCEMYNTYSYGSRAAFYPTGKDVYVENSVFVGGVLANMVLACSNITLNNVTTIQNVNENIPEITDKNLPVGLSIYVDSEALSNTIKINLQGDFLQYNWIDSELISKIKDVKYQLIASTLLNKYSVTVGHNMGANNSIHINSGIVFMGQVSKDYNPINDERTNKEKYPLTRIDESVSDVAGTIYTYSNEGSSSNKGNEVVINKRFDSNDFQRVFSTIRTKPDVNFDLDLIDEKFKASLDDNILTIKINNDEEFIINDSYLPFNVMYYGEDLAKDPNLKIISISNEIRITKYSDRLIEFSINVTIFNSFDINGNWNMKSEIIKYDFSINSVLPENDAEFITDGKSANYYYAKYFTWSLSGNDYYLCMEIFDAFAIKDWDPVKKEYVEINFSDATSTPNNLKIEFYCGSLGNPNNQFFSKLNNGKYVLISTTAADEPGDKDAIVTITYTGYNGKTISKEFHFKFTSNTNSIKKFW